MRLWLWIRFYFVMKKFMLKLKPDTHSDMINAFNNISCYLDDIFKTDDDFFQLSYKEI